VIVPVLMEMFNPKSVVDVGCGLGTFLKVFKAHGVSDVLGCDGSWVRRDLLVIPESEFRSVDLKEPLKLDKRYDLVICLEVAEHLPDSAADTLVRSLVDAGELIVFSAAIPQQGGQNHINEQWIDYWRPKFNRLNYEFFDLLREEFWDHPGVFWWYKQNMLVAAPMAMREKWGMRKVLNLVHPDLFMMRSLQHDHYVSRDVSVLEYLKLGFKAVLMKLNLRN
jgi:SAM-dependent methyltransferase